MSQTEELEPLFTRALNRPDTISDDDLARILDAVAAGTDLDVVRTLSILAQHDPDTIDAMVDRLQPLLHDADDQRRGEAALVFVTVAKRYPERVTEVAPDAVDLLMDDFPASRNHALQLIARLADVDPELVTAAAPHLEPFLRSEALFPRLSALEITHAIARTEPGEVTDLVPALVGIATESTDEDQPADQTEAAFRGRGARTRRGGETARWQREQARARAAQTVAILAQERPASVAGSVQQLETVLEQDDHPIVLGASAEALAALAREGEAPVQGTIDRIGAVLDRPDAGDADSRVMLALSGLSDRHAAAVAEAVRPALSTVVTMLDAERPAVRGAAMSLLVVLSEQRPDAVRSSLGAVREGLDDESPVVRGGAAWVLGAAGTTEDRDRLVALRENDPDESVVEAANQALEELNERDGNPS